MRPTRFRGVIGFGDQKYVERMSNYRIRIGEDPTAGMQHHSTPRIPPDTPCQVTPAPGMFSATRRPAAA
jgi:hypothetical protein